MKRTVTIKTITSIIIIVAAIIAVSVFSQHILYRDSGKLVQSINKVEESMKKEDWNQSEKQVIQIIRIWEDVKGTWSVLLDHQEIDNIDVTLTRLQTLIKSRDNSSAPAEAAALKKYVNHIPAKEKLSLDNVF